VTDAIYLKILASKIDGLFAISKPDIVFHIAGCDALKGDPLASGEMTHEGIKKRDAMIVKACEKYGVPYVMTLSGGYSKDAWNAQYKSISALIANKL
jgi:acetoin utilization deacetylase AcuC-like enzyme